MTAHEVAVAALLALAVLVAALSTAGMVTARPALARMHFLGPVTSLAGPAVAAAAVVQEWPAVASAAKALLIAAILFAGGPVVTHVLARTDRGEAARPDRGTAGKR